MRNLYTSSKIANHVLETGHAIKWDEASTLTRDTHHFRRVFKESWFSRVNKSGNRIFYEIDSAWDRLFYFFTAPFIFF